MKRLLSMVFAFGMIAFTCTLAEGKNEISKPVTDISIVSTPMAVVNHFEFEVLAVDFHPVFTISSLGLMPPEIVLNDDPGNVITSTSFYRWYDLDLNDKPIYSCSYKLLDKYRFRPNFAMIQKHKFKYQRSYSC